MTDFGIDPPGLLFVSTEDEVEVWWNVVFAPAPATPVPARVHPVSLTELQPGRESATPEVSAQRLWIAGESSLWERPSRWTLAQGGKVSELELATGRSAPLPASSEESFAAIRERLANLRAEQATASEERRLSLEESVRQISRILALAPPEVAPTLERSGDDIELRFGETAWLVLRGNHGKGRVAPLFASIAGIPEAALELLQTIEHVPAEVELRTGTPAGARIYRIRIEPAQRAELPDWALEPKGWTKGES
jgi:hypothetical protein